MSKECKCKKNFDVKDFVMRCLTICIIFILMTLVKPHVLNILGIPPIEERINILESNMLEIMDVQIRTLEILKDLITEYGKRLP